MPYKMYMVVHITENRLLSSLFIHKSTYSVAVMKRRGRQLYPPRNIHPCLEAILVSQLVKGYHWHLAGGGQRCYQISYNMHRASSTTKNSPAPNVHSADVLRFRNPGSFISPKCLYKPLNKFQPNRSLSQFSEAWNLDSSVWRMAFDHPFLKQIRFT